MSRMLFFYIILGRDLLWLHIWVLKLFFLWLRDLYISSWIKPLSWGIGFDELSRLLRLFCVNSHPCKTAGNTSGLLKWGTMINHSCLPNVPWHWRLGNVLKKMLDFVGTKRWFCWWFGEDMEQKRPKPCTKLVPNRIRCGNSLRRDARSLFCLQ